MTLSRENCDASGGRVREAPRLLLLQMHLLVALLATTAILGELISLPAPALVAWRTALAAAGGALAAAVVFRRSIRLPLKRVLPLLGIGGILGFHWMFFFGAIRLSNVSVCLAGLATVSFFTAFTEPFFDKRRIRPLEVALGLLVMVGIVIVAGFERGRLAGFGLALLSALLAAVFPVLNRRVVQRTGSDPLVMVVWEMTGACLACLAVLPMTGGSFSGLLAMHGLDWLWLLILAWACTVFAHGYHIHLLRFLSAYTSNLAINLEPVYGIIAASILFGEHRELHAGFFAGTAVIILANVLHPLILYRKSATSRLVCQSGDGGDFDA